MLTKTALIRGTQVNYFFICPTKLWLFSHFIQMEQNSELVELGKLIHEHSYSRERKEEIIDSTISIDFIKRKDYIELHEVKKSKKMEKAHVFQMLYYLYYLKTKGINAIGYIDYPKSRTRKQIVLTSELEKELKIVLNNIRKIIEGPIPKPVRKSICKKCSYYEFCFGG